MAEQEGARGDVVDGNHGGEGESKKTAMPRKKYKAKRGRKRGLQRKEQLMVGGLEDAGDDGMCAKEVCEKGTVGQRA